MKRMLKQFVVSLVLLSSCLNVSADTMIDVNFTKVTDFNTITDGDEILIVNEHSKTALAQDPNSTKNRLAREVVIDGNRVTSVSEDVSIITVEEGDYGFLFRVPEGYLAVKYNHLGDKNFYLTSEPTSIPSSNQSATQAFIDKDVEGNPRIVFTLQDDKKKEVSKRIAYSTNVFSTADYSPTSYSNVSIYRRTYLPEIAYDQDADMSSVLSQIDSDTEVNVMLNRQFTADDGWYTLCLPFAVSQEMMRRVFGNDVNIQEFDGSTNSGNTLTLNFIRVTSALEAGKPYLIKPTKSVVTPVFKKVTIAATIPSEVVKGDYRFIGVFSPFMPTAEDKTIRFLSGENGKRLDYPSATTGALKGTRAYFKFPASDASSAANAMTDDELRIEKIENMDSESSDISSRNLVFSIDGKLIGDKVDCHFGGVYIHNGKKYLKKQ